MAARKKSGAGVSEHIRALSEAMRGKISSSDMEDLVKFAIDVINQDYWDDVRGVTNDLLREIKDGHITSREQLSDKVHDAIDGTQRVIYTFQARLGLLATNNADAYEDEMGDKPESVEAQMFWAMQADVMAQLEAHDEVQELE